MDRSDRQDAVQTSDIKQVLGASFIGTAIEWYDFFIYGTAATLVFGQLFFSPEFSPLAATLSSVATFAVGFVARPFGGIIFGHFGDKLGRKAMLVLTLNMMGIATFLIGLMPTFESIGLLAPVLLVLLRVVQGLGVGGEWGGAALMAVEYAPEDKRGYYGSWPQMGVPAGLLLATGVFGAVSFLPNEQFLAWGWRIPFLLSIILVGVGLFIRLRLLETPSFSEVQESQTEAQMPIMDVFRNIPEERSIGDRGARRQRRRLLRLHRVHTRLCDQDFRSAEVDDTVGGHACLRRRTPYHPAFRRDLRPHRSATSLPGRHGALVDHSLPLFPYDPNRVNDPRGARQHNRALGRARLGLRPDVRLLRRAFQHAGPVQRGLHRLSAGLHHRRRGRAAHQHLPGRRHGRLLLAGGRVDSHPVRHNPRLRVRGRRDVPGRRVRVRAVGGAPNRCRTGIERIVVSR